MIDPTLDPVFPNNVVYCLSQVFPSIDPDVKVYNRPLRGTDPSYAIGVYGTLWTPDEQSFEIDPRMAHEPTLQEYQIGIQSLIKDGDPIRALQVSSILNKRIRGVLYRNAPLRVLYWSTLTMPRASSCICTSPIPNPRSATLKRQVVT